MHKFLFGFLNTHQALNGEKTLKAGGWTARLVPTPFEIFSECGFSLEVHGSEEDLEELMKNQGEWYAECYLILSNNGRTKKYERLYSGCQRPGLPKTTAADKTGS